ncbi:MAG: CsgG/HfaB family protein [Acidobacteria bacterium]|jgi:TolB-like protein|nr:CsgG/HfaB family protein [Acidobacteriota bacterium]
MKRRTWLLLAASLLSLHCGYRLAGRGDNLPAGAATIAIPAFKNQSSSPQAEQFVTFAVRQEFIRRGRLRLVETRADADLLLEGTITAFKTTPLSYSDAGGANFYEVRLTLDVRLVDMRSNEMAFQGSGLVFQETYDTEGADFFSQESGSLDKIAAQFAAAIVTSILENF